MGRVALQFQCSWVQSWIWVFCGVSYISKMHVDKLVTLNYTKLHVWMWCPSMDCHTILGVSPPHARKCLRFTLTRIKIKLLLNISDEYSHWFFSMLFFFLTSCMMSVQGMKAAWRHSALVKRFVVVFWTSGSTLLGYKKQLQHFSFWKKIKMPHSVLACGDLRKMPSVKAENPVCVMHEGALC